MLFPFLFQPVDMPDPYQKRQKKCIICEHNIKLDYKVSYPAWNTKSMPLKKVFNYSPKENEFSNHMIMSNWHKSCIRRLWVWVPLRTEIGSLYNFCFCLYLIWQPFLWFTTFSLNRRHYRKQITRFLPLLHIQM